MTYGDVVQAALALAAVLGLMWLLARLSRRTLGVRGNGVLDVVARHPLSRSASVAVVRVADKTLVLGVTEQSVSLLGEADPVAVEAAIEVAEQERVPTARTSATPSAPAGPTTRSGRRRSGSGAVGGSLLSPQTWRDTVEFLRARTARRG